MKPILHETTRLAFSYMSIDDITDELVGWLNSDHMRFSENSTRNHSIQTCREYLRYCVQQSIQYVSIKRKVDSRLIGTLTVNHSAPNRRADVGILIGPDYCGSGYGTESFSFAVKQASCLPDVLKVTAGTTLDNLAMIRIFERCGLAFEGYRANHLYIFGSYKTLVFYSLFVSQGLR